jgi:Radical SAM superfamily
MKILLLLPPLTQINSPYPSTAYLTGYLRSRGYEVAQRDLGLELILRLFNTQGLERVRCALETTNTHDSVQFFQQAFADYQATIKPVIRFLQGKDSSLALRICQRTILPEGPRFLPLAEHDHLLELFGTMGTQDKAKYLASLYLDDLADVIRHGVDGNFEFSRYAESLASSQSSFSALAARLEKRTLIDEVLEELVAESFKVNPPDVVGLSVPFAGNLYGALRIGKFLAQKSVHRIMGGGYVNTELRSLEDARVFDYIDELCFDDGEKPLELILQSLANKNKGPKLRTLTRANGQISRDGFDKKEKDIAFKDLPGPDFSGLPLNSYVSMLEMPNPMHRLWSDHRWNKMILAHGCYWKKCTFCDVSLDYIGRFEPARVDQIIAQIENVIAQTGSTGFHFVDEAAPPALLKALSQELLKRKIQITWWGNLRFDKQFTPELAELMADAGCIAVTGGLEVASPRVLKLINKGLEVEQAARVMKAFTDKGIYTHAYLMYGFPTQTAQETIDSLEVVRQLFLDGCLHSGHWHRFLATAHSPVGLKPKDFGVKLHPVKKDAAGLFAQYEIPFTDKTETNHDVLGVGLHRALYNYMHGVGLEKPLSSWFDVRIPKKSIRADFVRRALALG